METKFKVQILRKLELHLTSINIVINLFPYPISDILPSFKFLSF